MMFIKKINIRNFLLLTLIAAVIFYCVYGLLTDGNLYWITRRAIISLVTGIITSLAIGFLGLKRPNKIVRY